MKTQKTINLALQFSRFPGGRFNTDGEFNGEKFREKFLKPALDENKSIVVELDGTAGYGSSFLEEAFGGLVRELHMDPADLERRMTLVSNDKSLISEIWEYIKAAK